MSTTAVGLLAGLLTTGAWLPQIYRSWTTRSCSGLSWIYLATMVAGFATWLAFGLLAGELAVIVTNAFSLVMAVALTWIKASSSGTHQLTTAAGAAVRDASIAPPPRRRDA